MSAGFHHHSDHFEIIGAVDTQVAKPGLGKSAGTSTECNLTYQRNIGITPMDADLAILSPTELRRSLGLKRGELDVLISCAPCTGFSQKNARNHSEDDPRNGLVPRTAEFVEELQPEFLVMENVKELLTGNQSHHFRLLKQRLEKSGYSLWAEVHDLSEYGLPQKRRRALLLARRSNSIIGLPPSRQRARTVRETIGHLPPIQAGEEHPSDPMHRAPSMTGRVLDRIKSIPKDGGSWADIMNDPTISRDRREYLLIPSMFRARPGSFPDVYGRLWWDRPAITITRECAHVGNGRYTHPEQDRLLSVREMALLQGFPPDYVFEGRLTSRYNQIGDSVPPLISKLIARHIIRLKTSDPSLESELAAAVPQLSLL